MPMDIMELIKQLVIIAVAVFGSTGFWALITYLIQRHAEKDSTEKQMLKGLAHDRICGSDWRI